MPDLGCILWEGESRIDGSPIVVIMTYHSANTGTGDMCQTWILRRDVGPTQAIGRNLDIAVCGNCPLRGDNGKGNSCYVNTGHGPDPIFRAYQNGRYPPATPDALRYHMRIKPVRLGAYGDPCAVPLEVWTSLLTHAPEGHTGYTHQWAKPENQGYKGILMASVESRKLATAARRKGWRTFRIMLPGDVPTVHEITCPKSESVDPMKRKDCLHCKACDGADRPGKRSVAIQAHGSRPKLANAIRAIERA